ncbi:MAG TPA: efflux RND transporter periplasmic adaptor subunit [Vicinamibacterales bacterium]|nr:efflux RND transporter periplasmic adaptor subunit [Vicinamibacterales bacterium]
MAKRMILMLVVMVAIISGLGVVKFKQIQTAIAQGAAFQPPPEAVTTVVAKEDRWPSTLSAVGSAAAVQGVTVSADLPGTVDRVAFDSGRAVQSGEVLVELDTRQERAQLAAAEADRDLAKVNFDRMEGLLNESVISKAEYDKAASERKQTEAKVGEIEAMIARKTIKAPFTGILGIRQVNRGQYLKAGDPIVELQALNPIYVNFDVPQQDAERVRVGRAVQVTAKDMGTISFNGQVTALNSVVDQATRNVKIQATLANPEGKLRPGMFVDVEVTTGAVQSVIALPASAISYAPFGDSVFIITDMKTPDGKAYKGVRQQFVKVGPTRGDQVAVLSGVKPNDEIATSGLFKLRTGVAVLVNNSVQPGNNPTAKPVDR